MDKTHARSLLEAPSVMYFEHSLISVLSSYSFPTPYTFEDADSLLPIAAATKVLLDMRPAVCTIMPSSGMSQL